MEVVRSMKNLLQKFKDGSFELKEPWRASEKSLAIIVPIVVKQSLKDRGYVVLEEVKDNVTIEDTGDINKLRLTGKTDKPVFIRGGSILKGPSQERASQVSVVAIPNKPLELLVHCVHARKGINPGAQMFFAGLAPRKVRSSMMLHKSQHHTWQAVSGYSRRTLSSPALRERRTHIAFDDLVGVTKATKKFREDLKDLLKQIPDYKKQVGVIIIDPEGVVGFEMYDHYDSWKAFSESIIRSYSEALTKEDKTGIFKPDMSIVVPLVWDFLGKLEKTKGEPSSFKSNIAKTTLLKVEGKTETYVGEYTTLNKKCIHLSVVRHKDQKEPMTRDTMLSDILSRDILRRRQVPQYRRRREGQPQSYLLMTTKGRPEAPVHKFFEKLAPIIEQLDKPKTWTSLDKKSHVSTSTLASKLKTLQSMKLVEKKKTSNGVTRYHLTGYGHDLKHKLTQRRKQ